MKKIVIMIACAVLLMSAATAKAQIYSGSNFDSEILISNDYDEALFGTTNSEEFGGVLADLSIGVSGGMTGQQIVPFGRGGNDVQTRYDASVAGRGRPGGDPTNQIPVGSGLCLVIGLALFIVARVFYAFRHEVKNI